MAIQIRRGTESGWETNYTDVVVGEPVLATDTERFFIGTGTGTFAEFANIDNLAPAYDSSVQWYEGQYCVYQGKLYVASADTTGAFDSDDWTEANINTIVSGFTQNRALSMSPSLGDDLRREVIEPIERREAVEEPVEEPIEEEPVEETEEEPTEEVEEEPIEEEPTEEEETEEEPTEEVR